MFPENIKIVFGMDVSESDFTIDLQPAEEADKLLHYLVNFTIDTDKSVSIFIDADNGIMAFILKIKFLIKKNMKNAVCLSFRMLLRKWGQITENRRFCNAKAAGNTCRDIDFLRLRIFPLQPDHSKHRGTLGDI